MPRRTGAVVALLVTAAVGVGLWSLLDVGILAATLVGVIYGIYGWVLYRYPLARRLHFRRLEGLDFWLSPALIVVTVATLATVVALPLPLSTAAVLYLTVFGALLAVGTLGGLLGMNEGVIDEEWLSD